MNIILYPTRHVGRNWFQTAFKKRAALLVAGLCCCWAFTLLGWPLSPVDHSRAQETTAGDKAGDISPAAAPGANNAAAAASPTPSGSPSSFLEIVMSGGPFGQAITLSIFILSLIAVTLVIEHFITIRAPVLMPPGVSEQVIELLSVGNVPQAVQICHENPSFLSFVLQSGIGEIEAGWSGVEKAMEDALADRAARLSRKVETLSVIANIAPMLGLLGTVFGMVLAFRQVAMTEGVARASDLADGIYQALITTVAGLVVAIPALTAFAYFRNRVDQLTAETAYQAQHVFNTLKRKRRRATKEGD